MLRFYVKEIFEAMNTEFKDYFSENSEQYSKFRPIYPEELFSYLASISNGRQKAWDCATGNGQSALSLANYFNEVIATDASKSQIANAIKKQVLPISLLQQRKTI